MRHCVFCCISNQIFKDPVCLLSVQCHDHFILRNIQPEVQIRFRDLFFHFQLHLFEQIHNVNVGNVQIHGFAACFTDLKQIFDQCFQSERLSIQHIDIFFLSLRILFNLQKIHIGDDRRQRRLKVMRDIRYQFSLHTLAFYFLIYRLLESALDLLDFFFKWLEYTQILIDFYIQIAICNLICRFQKSVIIPFHLIKIFF